MVVGGSVTSEMALPPGCLCTKACCGTASAEAAALSSFGLGSCMRQGVGA